jgi:hypothetical protein
MADEAEKPKYDQDDDYGPEHRYAFPLSLFKHRIPTEFREAIKRKLDQRGSDEAAVPAEGDKSCALDGEA